MNRLKGIELALTADGTAERACYFCKVRPVHVEASSCDKNSCPYPSLWLRPSRMKGQLSMLFLESAG